MPDLSDALDLLDFWFDLDLDSQAAARQPIEAP